MGSGGQCPAAVPGQGWGCGASRGVGAVNTPRSAGQDSPDSGRESPGRSVRTPGPVWPWEHRGDGTGLPSAWSRSLLAVLVRPLAWWPPGHTPGEVRVQWP